jgi:CRP-like cAMP-binding protein
MPNPIAGVEEGSSTGPSVVIETHWDASRRLILRGASIRLEQQDDSRCYLIESGLVAVSVTPDRTLPTCVGLLGPGSLIAPAPGADDRSRSYRAVASVDLVEIPVSLLRQSMHRQPTLGKAYQGQLEERLAQAELAAACNAHHSLSERCARWLLRLHHHLGGVIPVTHAFLAALLGVRRAGVSITLQMLQREGAIRQQRGRVVIIDPARLAAYACPCPDGLFSPKSAISAALIGSGPPGYNPRAWIEREIRVQTQRQTGGDETWARREAALRLCEVILAQGEALLQP